MSPFLFSLSLSRASTATPPKFNFFFVVLYVFCKFFSNIALWIYINIFCQFALLLYNFNNFIFVFSLSLSPLNFQSIRITERCGGIATWNLAFFLPTIPVTATSTTTLCKQLCFLLISSFFLRFESDDIYPCIYDIYHYSYLYVHTEPCWILSFSLGSFVSPMKDGRSWSKPNATVPTRWTKPKPEAGTAPPAYHFLCWEDLCFWCHRASGIHLFWLELISSIAFIFTLFSFFFFISFSFFRGFSFSLELPRQFWV